MNSTMLDDSDLQHLISSSTEDEELEQFDTKLFSNDDHYSNSNNIEAQRLSTKRKRSRRVIFAPKVFKTDIRKRYAEMLVNVLNICDVGTTFSFFQTYSARNVEMIKLCNNVRIWPTGIPERIYIQEARYIAKYWSIIQELLPDCVVALENVQVFTRSDTSSSFVTFDLRTKFTNLYEVPVPKIAAEAVHKIIERDKGRKHDSSSKDFQQGSSSEALESWEDACPNFLEGKTLHLKFSATLCLNAHKHFEKISFSNIVLVQ